MPAAAPQTQPEANPFFPGVSYYNVLQPSPIIGPGGVRQLAMHGPFQDLATASQYANARPGSMISVTLILHEIPAGPAPAAPAPK